MIYLLFIEKWLVSGVKLSINLLWSVFISRVAIFSFVASPKQNVLCEPLLSKPYLYLQVPAVSKRKIVFKGTCFSQTFSGYFNTIPIEPDVAALPQSYFLEDIDTDQCDLFSEATASLEGPVRTQESESDG